MKPPVWVRILDAAALILLALTLFVLVFGGLMLYAGPLPIRVHAPLRLVFLTAAALALRHVAYPADPLHRRLARRFQGIGGDSPEAVAGLAVASRAAVLLTGFLAVV